MKKREWDNPNKMHFESEHKIFNRHATCISAGNCIGDVQLSGYIRPYNKTKCNGTIFKPGALQTYDLNWLNEYLPSSLKEWVRKNGKDKAMIGYTFFYWEGDKRTFIGWVITDADNKYLTSAYAENTQEVRSDLDECKEYICD